MFLGKLDKEIIELIEKVNYSIEENAPICLMDKKFIGFHEKNKKKIIICTENAKEIGNYRKNSNNNNENHKTKIYLRRALRHEATHLAQECNNGQPTGIIKNIDKKIHKSKLDILKSSVQISGDLQKEVEAYVMEDKPKLVIKAIQKYCF